MLNKFILFVVTFLGKMVKFFSRLRGGGSALPGLFVERVYPGYLKAVLRDIPLGVVVVSGTNGKTSTTKMISEILKAHDVRVFTNSTGSNFSRGVISELLSEVSFFGKLSSDIAVIEMDEAHAEYFVELVNPDTTLLLNVMRDQLDRFHELSVTAKLLENIASKTTRNLIINREDSYLMRIAEKFVDKNVLYFGVSSSLKKEYPNILGLVEDKFFHEKASSDEVLGKTVSHVIDVEDASACVDFAGSVESLTLKSRGVYNVLNAAAAFTTVVSVLGVDGCDVKKSVFALENMLPAFGRGESFVYGGDRVEILLVKNPSGFQLNLDAIKDFDGDVLLAINDKYADGTDVSWLWNVDFTAFSSRCFSVVTGKRSWDMSLRLFYDGVSVDVVEPDIGVALQDFLSKSVGKDKVFIATYTAMLEIRKFFKKDF